MKIESVIEKLINRWLDACRGFLRAKITFRDCSNSFLLGYRALRITRVFGEERPRKEGKREIEFLDWNDNTRIIAHFGTPFPIPEL